MKLTQKAKYVGIGAVAMTVAIPLVIKATDSIPLNFSQGDILSAEVLNAIFTRINRATSPVQQDSLVGSWECAETRDQCSGGFGWADDGSGLFCTRSQTYTFADAGDGTLTLTTSKGMPLRAAGAPGQEGNVPMTAVTAVIPTNTNLLRFTHQGGVDGKILVQRLDADRLRLNEVAQANSATCTKQSQPPAPPTSLSATASGTNVTLTWVAQSADETGFKVQTKTAVKGTWTTVSTTAADVQSAAITAAIGNNWYRVLATNANGDSITSNEILVEVE